MVSTAVIVWLVCFIPAYGILRIGTLLDDINGPTLTHRWTRRMRLGAILTSLAVGPIVVVLGIPAMLLATFFTAVDLIQDSSWWDEEVKW